MVDVARALEGHLRASDTPRQEFRGLSSGLNASDRANRLSAVMYVTADSVLVGWEKLQMLGLGRNKVIVERFERSEIMEVVEGDTPKTGIRNTLDSRTASTLGGQLIGVGPNEPAITLVTRRGDLIFAFKRKDRGQVRQAFVAVSDLIGDSAR